MGANVIEGNIWLPCSVPLSSFILFVFKKSIYYSQTKIFLGKYTTDIYKLEKTLLLHKIYKFYTWHALEYDISCVKYCKPLHASYCNLTLLHVFTLGMHWNMTSVV